MPGEDVFAVGVWGGNLDLFNLVAGFEVFDYGLQVPVRVPSASSYMQTHIEAKSIDRTPVHMT